MCREVKLIILSATELDARYSIYSTAIGTEWFVSNTLNNDYLWTSSCFLSNIVAPKIKIGRGKATQEDICTYVELVWFALWAPPILGFSILLCPFRRKTKTMAPPGKYTALHNGELLTIAANITMKPLVYNNSRHIYCLSAAGYSPESPCCISLWAIQICWFSPRQANFTFYIFTVCSFTRQYYIMQIMHFPLWEILEYSLKPNPGATLNLCPAFVSIWLANDIPTLVI